jgi:hypothetical protein
MPPFVKGLNRFFNHTGHTMKHLAHCFAVTIVCASLLACGKKSESSLAPAAAGPSGPVWQGIGSVKADGSAKPMIASNVSGTAAAASAPSSNPSSEQPAADNASGTAASTAQQLSTAALSATPKGRQLVRKAQIKFAVKDVYLATLAIEDALTTLDGYVEYSQIESTPTQQSQYLAENGTAQQLSLMATTGTIKVRLPSGKAEQFLRTITPQITTLEHRQFTADDVQFNLLRQQLEALRAQSTGADLAQLSQQAGRIADKNQTIAQRRQAVIEANEAHLDTLTTADQVTFASLTLQVSQPAFVRKTLIVDFESAQAPYQPSFASRAAHALRDGWAGLQSFVVAMLNLWPLLLVLLAGVLVWRSTRPWSALRGALRQQRKGDAQ